ncbi:MAG TPA: zinc-binding dehydrogenase [Solirubrobacteraceae bacterium]|nr:zinc-binding dehydrogenase [Solirubrobacteraceae bacterium]
MTTGLQADRATMRALVTDGRGGVEAADVPVPRPNPGEALVRVLATSLNRGELRFVEVTSGAVPGWDVAGELVEDVPAAGLDRGTLVVGLVDEGAWAEYAAVPLAHLAPLPGGVCPAEAAALPTAGLTALQSLRLSGSLLGRRALITGAAGGVGRFAVQLAAASGADVTAVARDAARGAGLRQLGADAVVTSLDGLESFDFILESVGGETLTRAFALLAPGGDLVSIGQSSREPGVFEPRLLFNGAYGARIHPYMVFEGARGIAGRDLAILLELVRRGRLDPQVERTLGWREVDGALADLAERRVAGKAVLLVD